MLYQDWDLVLAGQNVRITPMQPQDREPYLRLVMNGHYDKFVKILGYVPDSGFDEILNRTRETETHALRPIDGDEFIGWIALQYDDERSPDIGISIIPEYQNRGLCSEAVKMFANRLMDAYGLTRVYVRISAMNAQSQRAFAKLGAVLDSTGALQSANEACSVLSNIKVHFYHIDLPIV